MQSYIGPRALTGKSQSTSLRKLENPWFAVWVLQVEWPPWFRWESSSVHPKSEVLILEIWFGVNLLPLWNWKLVKFQFHNFYSKSMRWTRRPDLTLQLPLRYITLHCRNRGRRPRLRSKNLKSYNPICVRVAKSRSGTNTLQKHEMTTLQRQARYKTKISDNKK